MVKDDEKRLVKYYSNGKVVRDYEKRRFKGFGGEYINKIEIGLIAKILNQVQINNKTILDLGAGKGRLSIALEKEGFSVYCLDSSSEMIEELRRLFPKNKLIRQSVFNRINLSNKVGAIVSLRFFDHFGIESQKKILINGLKVLDKDGYLVFACLNKYSLESLFSRFFSYGRYNYYYSSREYHKLFCALKLTVVSQNKGFIFPRGIFLYLPQAKLLISTFTQIDILLSKVFSGFNNFNVYLLKKSL